MTESKHFEYVEVTEGVVAAIHKAGGWAIGNAGIVDLGNKTVIFDTGMTPAAGQELRQAAEALTSKAAGLVINSHYHNDHIWGNQVFENETLIISDKRVDRQIQSQGMEEYQYYRDNAPGILSDLQEQLKKSGSDEEKTRLTFAAGYYEAIATSMPKLQVRRPDITFFDNLAIRGSKRSIELLSYVNCHTGCDTIMFLPQDNIIFMADLLFVRTHPFIADGDPDNLIETLPKISNLGANILIPGHGPAGGAVDIEHQRAYIEHCRDKARRAVDSKLPMEELTQSAPPAPYASWDIAMFYSRNLAYYYEKFSA